MKHALRMLLCGALLAITVSAFAGDVVVTKHSKVYHLATCAKIKNKEVSTMDEKQAQQKNLRPCKVCIDKDSTETKK